LRPEITGETPADPGLLLAVGHAILAFSVPGIMFGLPSLRTRNLLLVALRHGVNDFARAVVPTGEWLRGGGILNAPRAAACQQ
jgi:hypothetical protein